MRGDGEQHDDEAGAEVARAGQHRQPRDAAAGEDHAGAEQKAAEDDGDHGQVAGEEPVLGKVDPAARGGELCADDGGREGHAPDPGGGGAVARIARDGAAKAEPGDFGQHPEGQAKDHARPDRRLGGGEGLQSKVLKHERRPPSGKSVCN